MKAITLYPPWPWCFTNAGKRLENRDWKPYGIAPGDYIALHAGKTWDEDGFETVDRADEDPEWAERLGVIGQVPRERSGFVFGAVTAVIRYLKTISSQPPSSSSQMVWWCGSYGWIFDEVHVLPSPVSCRGHQKLWNLEPDTEREVKAQWARADRVWTAQGWGCLG